MSTFMYVYPWIVLFIVMLAEEVGSAPAAKEVAALSIGALLLIWLGVFLGSKM